MRKIYVGVATPSSGQTKMCYAISLAKMVAYFSNNRLLPDLEEERMEFLSVEGSGISENRELYLIESFPSPGSETPDVFTSTVNFNEKLGDDLVAFALPVNDRLSKEGILLSGDRVDLLFSTDVVGQKEGTGGKVSIYAIQDLEVLQVIYQPAPQPEGEQKEENKDEGQSAAQAMVPKTMILAMDPQDAVVLKYALDTQSPIDLVLRAQDNRRLFDVDTVSINTISERYRFEAPKPLP